MALEAGSHYLCTCLILKKFLLGGRLKRLFPAEESMRFTLFIISREDQ